MFKVFIQAHHRVQFWLCRFRFCGLGYGIHFHPTDVYVDYRFRILGWVLVSQVPFAQPLLLDGWCSAPHWGCCQLGRAQDLSSF
jgi:hypothetical protein